MKSSPLFLQIKFCWNTAMSICLRYTVCSYGCFHVTMSESNGCNIKPKIFTWPLQKQFSYNCSRGTPQTSIPSFKWHYSKTWRVLDPFALGLSTLLTVIPMSQFSVAQILNMPFQTP